MSVQIGYGSLSSVICGKEFNPVKGVNLATPIIEEISSISKTIICAIGSLFQAAKTLLKLPLAVVLAPFAFVLEKVAGYLKEEAVEDLKKIAKKGSKAVENYCKAAENFLKATEKYRNKTKEDFEAAEKALEAAMEINSTTLNTPAEMKNFADERIKFAVRMEKFAEGVSFLKDFIMTAYLVSFTFSDKIVDVTPVGELRNTVKDVFVLACEVVGGTHELYDLPVSTLWGNYIYGDEQCEEEAVDKFAEDLAAYKEALAAKKREAISVFT